MEEYQLKNENKNLVDKSVIQALQVKINSFEKNDAGKWQKMAKMEEEN